MKPLIVSCSQANTEAELRQRYNKYHILNSARLSDAGITVKYGNKSSLAKVYNNYITTFDREAVLVLTHDDVCITDNDWIEKLEQSLEKYDVVGLAGGSSAKITEPCLWHLMCPRDTLKGRVSHVYEGTNDTFVTHFGNQGRVLILDGLFLAFKAKTLLDTSTWFDETNPCVAHFYYRLN